MKPQTGEEIETEIENRIMLKQQGKNHGATIIKEQDIRQKTASHSRLRKIEKTDPTTLPQETGFRTTTWTEVRTQTSS